MNFSFFCWSLFDIVVGSILPSVTTIFSNALSLRWILNIRGAIEERSSASRNRTDETRRVIIIVTTECLLAILNSWLIDIILSMKYCHRSVAIGDDCPHFLRRHHQLLVVFDLLNSMSNILLYCFAGKRFRRELQRMLKAGLLLRTKRPAQQLSSRWKHQRTARTVSEDEEIFITLKISTKFTNSTSTQMQRIYECIRLRPITPPTALSWRVFVNKRAEHHSSLVSLRKRGRTVSTSSYSVSVLACYRTTNVEVIQSTNTIGLYKSLMVWKVGRFTSASMRDDLTAGETVIDGRRSRRGDVNGWTRSCDVSFWTIWRFVGDMSDLLA